LQELSSDVVHARMWDALCFFSVHWGALDVVFQRDIHTFEAFACFAAYCFGLCSGFAMGCLLVFKSEEWRHGCS
jgi:hypothetical protein